MRFKGKRAVPDFVSDGPLALPGIPEASIYGAGKRNTIDIIYEADRGRCYRQRANCGRKRTGHGYFLRRIRHKDGHLVDSISGRRIGPKADTMRFYAVFTGMSEDAILVPQYCQ